MQTVFLAVFVCQIDSNRLHCCTCPKQIIDSTSKQHVQKYYSPAAFLWRYRLKQNSGSVKQQLRLPAHPSTAAKGRNEHRAADAGDPVSPDWAVAPAGHPSCHLHAAIPLPYPPVVAVLPVGPTRREEWYDHAHRRTEEKRPRVG